MKTPNPPFILPQRFATLSTFHKFDPNYMQPTRWERYKDKHAQRLELKSADRQMQYREGNKVCGKRLCLSFPQLMVLLVSFCCSTANFLWGEGECIAQAEKLKVDSYCPLSFNKQCQLKYFHSPPLHWLVSHSHPKAKI